MVDTILQLLQTPGQITFGTGTGTLELDEVIRDVERRLIAIRSVPTTRPDWRISRIRPSSSRADAFRSSCS
jgi:hypothetical protein